MKKTTYILLLSIIISNTIYAQPFLLGMMSAGGTSNNGTIIEYNCLSHTYKKKIDFYQMGAASSNDHLTLASNGKYYAILFGNNGYLIEYDYVTNTCVTKIDFDTTNMAFNGGYVSLIDDK